MGKFLPTKEKADISDQAVLLSGGLENRRPFLLVYLCLFILKWQLSEAIQCLEHEIKSQERWIGG